MTRIGLTMITVWVAWRIFDAAAIQIGVLPGETAMMMGWGELCAFATLRAVLCFSHDRPMGHPVKKGRRT